MAKGLGAVLHCEDFDAPGALAAELSHGPDESHDVLITFSRVSTVVSGVFEERAPLFGAESPNTSFLLAKKTTRT